MAAFMLLASIPDLLGIPQAVSIFGHLGYPIYLLPFLGTAKTLGVVVVLVPGFRRLKEWAFAGLVFDLIGALYSHLSVGDSPSGWMPAVIGLILVGGSYLSYRRRPIPDDKNVVRAHRGPLSKPEYTRGPSVSGERKLIKSAASIPSSPIAPGLQRVMVSREAPSTRRVVA